MKDEESPLRNDLAREISIKFLTKHKKIEFLIAYILNKSMLAYVLIKRGRIAEGTELLSDSHTKELVNCYAKFFDNKEISEKERLVKENLILKSYVKEVLEVELSSEEIRRHKKESKKRCSPEYFKELTGRNDFDF